MLFAQLVLLAELALFGVAQLLIAPAAQLAWLVLINAGGRELAGIWDVELQGHRMCGPGVDGAGTELAIGAETCWKSMMHVD